MSYVLGILCVLLIGYILSLHRLIRSMTAKLAQINSVQTNALIDLPSRNPYLIKLALEISRLIKLSKANYLTLINTQQQFDLAINNISHDIRTPLTVASGYAQLLARTVEGEQADLIAKISQNLTNVEEKLEDLLTYNRLLEQRVEVTLTEVNVSSLLENQVVTYYEAFQTKNIELDLEIAKDIRLISDPDLVKRMIENALGNILTHGAEQAKISLRQTEDHVRLSFTNHTHQVIENYDQLFERFYTEDLSRVNKNSGLGLYIVKELVTLLNGEVQATGVGSEFVLNIVFPTNQ